LKAVVRKLKIIIIIIYLNCGMDEAGLESLQGQEIFLFFKRSKPALGPIIGYWGLFSFLGSTSGRGMV